MMTIFVRGADILMKVLLVEVLASNLDVGFLWCMLFAEVADDGLAVRGFAVHLIYEAHRFYHD